MAIPSPEELRSRAAEIVPEARVDDAVAGVEPGWELRPASEGPVRVGGPAPLAPGEEWPRNDRGIPLTFLASIDTGGVPALPGAWSDRDGWPRGGEVLRLFADLLAVPFETCLARILVAPAGSPFVETAAPPVPDPWPVDHATAGQEGNYDDLELDERVRELPGSFARCEPALTADKLHFGWDDALDLEDYEAFANDVWAPLLQATDELGSFYRQGLGKLGGAPESVQDDPRFEADLVVSAWPERTDWAVLFELHSGWGAVDVLDGGAYCVCVPAEALAAGRYEPAVCTVQSG